MNECYFMECAETKATPNDVPFVNLLANSLATLEVETKLLQAGAITTLVNGNYQLMPYQACESMSGPVYALPIPAINTYAPFKGSASGFGGTTSGTYEIAYDLAITLLAPGTFDIICSLGATNLGTVSLAIATAGTKLLRLRIPFYVQSGNATNCVIQYHVELDEFGANSQVRNIGGTLTITGLVNGVISPTFQIRANIAPASWSAERKTYLFNRVA
jgi:hypothetical protein